MSEDETTIPGELWEELGGAVKGTEMGCWRVERRTRLDDARFWQRWDVVVSYEDKFLIRRYWRGRWQTGLTDKQGDYVYDAPVKLTRVYPHTKTVVVTEYQEES